MPTSPAANLHGPALAGIFVQSMLFGVSMMQTYHYFAYYKKDPLWIRLFVAVLMLTSLLNSIFSYHWIYNVLVNNFTNIEALLTLPWDLAADPALVGVTAAMVQCFFAWRIKVLTKNWFFTIFIVACATVTCVGGIVFAVAFHTYPSVQSLALKKSARVLAAVWLSPAAIADVTITGVMTWHLRKARTGFAVTDDIIGKVIRMTVQNGLVTTTIALLDLLTFIAMPNSGLHVAFSFPLPKLYANSILSSLCARDPNRHINSSSQLESSNNLRGAMNLERRRPEVFVSVEMQKSNERGSERGDAPDSWMEHDEPSKPGVV